MYGICRHFITKFYTTFFRNPTLYLILLVLMFILENFKVHINILPDTESYHPKINTITILVHFSSHIYVHFAAVLHFINICYSLEFCSA